MFSPHITSQAVNLASGQGLVLVASQTPAGFVLNRISSNPQAQTSTPASLFVNPQDVNLGAPPPDKPQHSLVLSPFAQQPQKNLSSSQFTGSPVVTGSSLFTHSDSNANPAHSQPFSYSSAGTTTTEYVQRQPVRHHGAHGSEFVNLFSPSLGTGNTFPVRTDNAVFPVRINNSPFKIELCDSEKEATADKRENLHLTSYNSKQADVCSPTFGNSVMTSENHSVINWALTNNVIEPSSSFSSQATTSQPQLIHAVLQQQQPQQQPHQRESNEGVAGPSGLNNSVKDMVMVFVLACYSVI